MDIKMKPLGGISATKQLKRKFPDARVVILTNYGDPIYRSAAKKAAADEFILKDDVRVLRLLLSGQPIPIKGL